MATELIDANTAAPAATVNAEEFARAITAQLAQTLKPTSTPAEQADEIRDVVAQLKGAGVDDADIQAHISTALGLDKKFSRLLKETETQATNNLRQEMQRKELNTTFSRVLRSYSKDDELITEASASIREKALADFINGTSAQIVTARNRFVSTGDLDEDVVDDIMAKHVKRFHQAADNRTGKKSNATPALKASDTTARPTPGGDIDNFNADSMTPIQEMVYESHLTSMKNSYPPDEAKKRALAAAFRVKK